MSFGKHGAGYFDHRTLYHIDRLHAWKHDSYFPPVVVEINPTSACNQRCRYCYVAGRTSGTMDDDLLLKIMSQLPDAGVKAVVFQGTGEPLLHKELPESIEVGAKNGLAMSVTTNGVLLNKRMQERILKHLRYIKFSNLEKEPKRYAYDHSCTEKQWETLIKNIKDAVATREEQDLEILYLSTVYLTKESFHEAYDILKYLKELGIDYVSIQEAIPNEYSYAGKEPLASSLFTEEEIAEMKKKVLTLKDKDFFVKVRFPLTDDTFTNGRYADCWVDNWCQGIKF
ncbi:MAG: radical SAM protein, partial [Sedimentisphaerales bacterium]